MLIIARKISQEIRIGEDIVVKIVAIGRSGKLVKLGIEVPRGIRVTRSGNNVEEEFDE